MKKLLAVCLLTFVSSTPAWAGNPNDISLGTPGYGGTGCPQGTVTAVLSPDAKSLSVLFDQYFTQTGRGVKLGRASCNVAVPVHVPQGLSVSLVAVDYRGFADIPQGGTGNFSVEYFFAGMKGPSRSVNFPGNYADNFTVSDTLQVGAIVWSACGEDVILRSNSNIRATKKGNFGDDAYIAVDSADFNAGIIYKLQWKHCF